MDILGRLREFTTLDFICSYSAKFFLGLGVGLLWGQKGAPSGWLFILLAVIVGCRAEVKFFKSHN
ncbi:MAG: hypothetical protein HY590_07770 [Candidatus Omnitrophica bacterium]|nr:hypothetical protein [Candidatus Omnitrophota bacterium]